MPLNVENWYTAAGKYAEVEGPGTVTQCVLTYEIKQKSGRVDGLGGSYESGIFKIRLYNVNDFTAGEIAAFRALGAKKEVEGPPEPQWRDYSTTLNSNYLPIPTPTPIPGTPTPTPT